MAGARDTSVAFAEPDESAVDCSAAHIRISGLQHLFRVIEHP
jgi:hypothetical protein